MRSYVSLQMYRYIKVCSYGAYYVAMNISKSLLHTVAWFKVLETTLIKRKQSQKVLLLTSSFIKFEQW